MNISISKLVPTPKATTFADLVVSELFIVESFESWVRKKVSATHYIMLFAATVVTPRSKTTETEG